MKKCIKCGSHAFNLYAEEIDQGGWCDVHYWQGRAHRAEAQPPLPVQAEQEPHNFCPRCGKRAQGVLGQPQVHTCTPPLWGYK